MDWDERYRQGQTEWDMGQVSPPLQTYFGQLQDKSLRILIPGCGNSYEAGYLLHQGFTDITLVDISEVLMGRLHEKFRDVLAPPAPATIRQAPLHLITADFFTLTGQYDLIIEQTFFCALDPALRPAYIDKTFHLLAPRGKLVGLLFDRDFSGGPPYGGSREEYAALLREKFAVKTLDPCYNSIKPRAGTELFFIAERQV